MKVAFLHTAQVHVETFDTLMQELAPGAECQHHVAAELLERAQRNGLSVVTEATAQILSDLSDADAVVCTCSTLGPIADQAAQTNPNIIRIDRPLMEVACGKGTNIIVAICLNSTKAATLELLADCASKTGQSIVPRLVFCETAWSHFEAGNMDQFAETIAGDILFEIELSGRPDCIVLAQASMRVAAPRLADLNLPILSSPRLVVERALTVSDLQPRNEDHGTTT